MTQECESGRVGGRAGERSRGGGEDGGGGSTPFFANPTIKMAIDWGPEVNQELPWKRGTSAQTVEPKGTCTSEVSYPATAGTAQHGTPSTPTDGAPQPLPVAVGQIDHYRKRNSDSQRRYPQPPPLAPDYYMSYGGKYAHRFNEQLKPKLSPAGQAWVVKTSYLLQTVTEDERARDPFLFGNLEIDDPAFRRFAYATHPSA